MTIINASRNTLVAYRSVILPSSALMELAKQDGVPVGTDIVEHFLNASALQGKHLVSHSTFGAPAPGSLLAQKPEIELVYHFIFMENV